MTARTSTFGRVPLDRPRMDAVPERYREQVGDLFDTWQAVMPRNREIKRYYEMKSEMKNLGISIPPQCEHVNSVVGWCSKAIAAHANRSRFDGFVSGTGGKVGDLDRMVKANRLRSLYSQAVKSALTYGVAAITVMREPGGDGAKVRVFSANQFAALWDKDQDRIACGVTLCDVDRNGTPSKYVVHMPDAVLTLTRGSLRRVDRPRVQGWYNWECLEEPNETGRPMMEVIVHDPDPDRPLGHSMITPELMGIVDKAMRDVLRMEVGAEFFTAPQRYILGASEDLFSESMGEGESAPASPKAKWQAYLGAFLALTRDENGEVPQVGQFAAGDAGNFTKVFENDAQRFSGATNVPLAQLGVLSNTYTSSDALNATDNPLILEVEVMNERNREAMENVAMLMQSVAAGVPIAQLTEEQRAVQAVFRNPGTTTMAANADAWTKIAALDGGIVGTPVWYENMGQDQATIARIQADKQAAEVTQSMARIADTLTAQAVGGDA